MEAEQISVQIRRWLDAGVRFSLVDGQVYVQGPRAALGADDSQWLRDNKTLLQSWLTQAPERLAEAHWPASDVQAAMWVASRLTPDMCAYNLLLGIRLHEPLDDARLLAATRTLLQRNDGLRTCLFEADDGLQARLMPVVVPALGVLNADLQDAHTVQARLDSWADQSFDLERGPLLRVAVVRNPDAFQLAALGFAQDGSQLTDLLFLCCHHLAVDLWGLQLLVQQWLRLYSPGNAAAEIPVAQPYRQFTQWQQQYLASEQGQRDGEYWQEHWVKRPVSDTPWQRHGSGGSYLRSYCGERLSRVLSPLQTEQVRTLARRCNTTPFVVVLAVFSAVEARYHGRQDAVIGSPVAGRSSPGSEQTIGHFVNLLVQRVEVTAAHWEQHILAVREHWLQAMQHADYPFPRILAALQATQASAVTDIPEAVLVWHQAGAQWLAQMLDLPQHLIKSVQDIWAGSGQRGAAYPVVLAVLDRGQDYRLEWTFDTGLFEAAAMAQRVDDFLLALDSLLREQNVSPAALPLVAESVVAASVVDGGDPALSVPATLWQRVEAASQATPASVALFDTASGRQLTWKQLQQQAENLAARLVASGAGSGSRIGLWLSRSLHWPVACVACWRINAAFVPLDRAAPPARIADILTDAGLQWVIAADDDFTAPEGVAVTVIAVEGDAAIMTAPIFVPDPDACAYLIYTSGSTGRPKGVAVAQRNLLAYSDGFESLCEQPARSAATLSPYTFDASIYELAGALLHGRELVILPDVLALDRDRWQSLLFVRPIDMLYVPPSLLDVLREAWATSGMAPPLRIMTGVEPIAHATLWRWLDLNPAMDILNQYGPTETTVAVTWYRVDVSTRQAQPSDRVPLGFAMPGARLELRDTLDRIVPRGCSGEAVVFGPQVGLGYVGHAAANDTRFGERAPGARFYRTGDWMRINRDGHLLYLGRADHQIKLRGVRVELGEVRAALLDLPGVRGAWIEARTHDTGTPFLVAHVASDKAAPALMTLLRTQLPPLLMPAYLMTHRELPLNRHGKVDAAALAALPLEQTGQEQRPPQTDAEHALWNAWCQELPQPPRHVGENFYALGGHSLIAARIASRVLAAGFKVAVADLLIHLEIESQAKCLTAAQQVKGLPRTTDGDIAITGPVLPFQFTLWAHENLHGPTRAYTVPFACRFNAPPPFELIEAQWARLMLRHEALRTGFVEMALGVQQQVRQDWPLPLHRHRIALADCHNLSALLQQLAQDCLNEPLSMTAGKPLWRMHWFEFDAPDTGSLMVALFHHSIFDGTSVQALADEWQSGSLQHAVLLPAMVDAVTDIQLQLQSVLEPGLAFWRKALAGREMADLPRRESPLAVDEPALRCYSRPLTREQLQQLEQVARSLGCSPFAVAFTLYQLVLARFSNHLNGAVAIPVDLRDAPHRGVVGGLVNTLSIPCVFDWNDSLAQAVGKTADFLRASQPYRAVPLDRVTQTFDGTAQQWLDTLFGSIFVWEDMPADTGPFAVEWLRLHPVDPKTDIEFVVGADGLHLLWRSSRFEPVTLQSLLDCYAFVLDRCAETLAEKIGYLPLFDATAFESQVRALCGDVRFTPPDASALDLIERRMQQTPDQLAVCRLSQGLTYAELRQLALDYADGLRRAGVTPGDRVAFCLERTPETVALLLGIWQAGAAYVPIDPRWPEDRRALVLGVAGCRCLVVESASSMHVPAGLPVLARADVKGQWAGPARLSLSDLSRTAYVLFTSGSTGVPKGVVINHGNLAAFLRWIQRYYPAEDFAGFLGVTTFAFDISVFEMFGTLASGGTLYLGEDPLALLDPAVRDAYAGKLTFLCSVPSAAIAWLDAGVIPAGIRTVNMGGEFLPQTIVERLYDAGVGRVLDLWGPTEDTTYSMVALRTRGGRPHIGKPIDDTQMWVVDSRLQPQPRGVKGELMLGGLGLSDGYLNARDLTARAFIANPFLPHFPHWAARIYHSGDIGWQDASDDLHYCARADFQMKIRGQRLEAGEIESRLRQHASVRTAVVLLHHSGEQTPFLLACVEAEPDCVFDCGALADFVRQTLPPYMVPGKWLQIERWPLNGNGKIDRRQVQALAQNVDLQSVQHDEDVQPLTALEETLLDVCASTLGGMKISLTCPLDQAGIDSIALLKLSFALQKTLGLPQAIPLSVWLQYRTLRAVATHLQHGFPLRTWTRLNDAPASASVLACIHAVGGEITGFRRLARAVGERWQVWAVALPQDALDVTGLQALAARYAAAWSEIGVQQVTLLGYSLGGLIGAHLIPELQARGVSVERLLLLDSHTPDALRENAMIRAFPDAVAAADAHWPTLYDIAVHAGWVPAGMPVEEMVPRLQAIGHLLRITLPESLPVIDVPVQHLASRVDECAARRYWNAVCRGALDFYSTPAWHGAVMDADFIDPVLALLGTIAAEPLAKPIEEVHPT